MIVVTSPTGKTQDVVAANFAAALAGLGMRVALVATDPRQSWFLNGQAAADDLAAREPSAFKAVVAQAQVLLTEVGGMGLDVVGSDGILGWTHSSLRSWTC